MLAMLSFFRKLAVPLALLMAIFLFVGVTGAPVVAASPIEVDPCCDKDAAPQAPVDNGDCFDCSCLSCLVVLHAPVVWTYANMSATSAYQLLFPAEPPPGYPRSIDYPPETA